MIQLYGYLGRSRSERVLWALMELGLPYEMERLDFKDVQNGKLSSLNPSQKVPVLTHNGKSFTESVAIIQYLNSLAGNSIIPDDPEKRYQYDNRLFFLVTEFEPYLWVADQDSFLSHRYTWPEGTTSSCKTAIARGMDQISAWLVASEYLANNAFSAVDILAYHLITWARLYGQVIPPHVESYLQRLEARDNFPETMRSEGSPAETG